MLIGLVFNGVRSLLTATTALANLDCIYLQHGKSSPQLTGVNVLVECQSSRVISVYSSLCNDYEIHVEKHLM